ncbi:MULTISPECIES: hypothetical protein [Streptomyces]|uniref:Translation initiation factor IF-2 n=1 Tax=Streptomyces edwardsiae TaxID=3075527 RepID=A0ABU2PXS0_9ACTN|nr:hypothetical protein [Streptomyces sp. DSM 41636]MDT0396940.1 hypothetical protein [Streptomyces sp. DSM 41636]
MRNWPEDAQPDRPEGAGAFGEDAEDENLRETRVLPLNEKPVRPGTGPDSLEDRWARLGVFPGGTDRTQVLPDATTHRAEPSSGGPATPSRDARESPWDAERTTALRVPRDPGGTPGERPTGPTPRQGGPRPPYDSGRPGAPTAPRRPSSGVGRPASGSPASGSPSASSEAETSVFQPATGRRPSGAPGGLGRPASGGPRPASADPATAVLPVTAGTGTDAPTELLKPASRATVRDPWQEDAGDSGAVTHDPHEVTVQLDSVQIGEGLELRRAAPGRAGGGQEAAAGPVFVDESGRRSRLYRRIGMAVGLACAGYAVVMVATLLSGNSDAPWMPVPGQEDKPAGQVETTPEPAETDIPPGAGADETPGSTPTTGAPTATAPGATAPATGGGAGSTADQPGSVDPSSPTATRRNDTGKPATGGGDDTTSTPSGDTVSTAPASPPVSEEPDPVTTAPTADGSDPRVAGAPAGQPVVVSDGSATPPATSTTPAAPSPENVV